MIRKLLAASAVLMISTAAQAQEAAQTPARPQGVPATDIPLLPGAQAAADCGGLLHRAGSAFCVTAPLGEIGALADAYIADLASRQWLAADGDDNRVVFVKRRDGGGCDGLQMQAFYDRSKADVTATDPGYLAFATIPGDVCAAQSAAPTAPANGNSPQ